MSSSSSSTSLELQDLKSLSLSSNPQTPNVLQHFLHDHPLIFKVAEETNEAKEIIWCKICDVDIELEGDQFYHCQDCSFSIHKSCAKLPKQVMNMLHPAHLLELSNNEDGFSCDVCDAISFCASYKCYECDFHLNIECLFLSYNPNSIMSSSSSYSTSLELLGQDLKNLSLHSSNLQTPNVILHFLHKHPLIFKEAKETTICTICNDVIKLDDHQFYHCGKCSFSIHKTCTELPKQVRNMLHPAHLLELSNNEVGFRCDACDEFSFCASYKCSICDEFDLDIKCVARNIFQEPQGHKEHKFEFLKPTLFTCDACGVDEVRKSRISCVCADCQFQVHRKCMFYSYPFTIKEPRHSHKLNLTFSFQMGDLDFADLICKICFRKMNNVLFMYSCDQCAYITHVGCGVSTNVLGVDLVGEIESLISPSSYLRSTEIHHNDQIEHFSHPHSLFLNNTEEPEGDNTIICDGCVRSISVPFYACDQCKFFLHRDCAELPNKIHSPLHTHQLTLITTWDRLALGNTFFTEFVSGFKCYGCKTICNGFMYECFDCDFRLDVGCSFLPGTLQLGSHECVSEKQKIKERHVGGELTLIDTFVRHDVKYWKDHDDPTYKSICNACGLSCVNKYVCQGCDFDLDLVCASLPQMILHDCPRHGWKKHPFKLKYHDIENVARMYICDACEKERDINDWYYYCEDCKYSAHPRCLVGHHRIKYGRSYEVIEHPHCVRLLKEPRLYWKHTCATCMQPLEKSGPALSCEECNIYFHCKRGCFSLVERDLALKYCINLGSQ